MILFQNPPKVYPFEDNAFFNEESPENGYRIFIFQLIFAAVVAVAAAAPSDSPYERDIVEILRQNIDHNDDLSYKHS